MSDVTLTETSLAEDEVFIYPPQVTFPDSSASPKDKRSSRRRVVAVTNRRVIVEDTHTVGKVESFALGEVTRVYRTYKTQKGEEIFRITKIGLRNKREIELNYGWLPETETARLQELLLPQVEFKVEWSSVQWFFVAFMVTFLLMCILPACIVIGSGIWERFGG
jgi:hypothetical protein